MRKCYLKSNAKWPIGIEVLNTLAKVSKILSARQFDDQEKLLSIQKMEVVFKELKTNFQNNLERIKDKTSYGSEIDFKREVPKPESNSIQENLVETINEKEVIDMHEYVNERQKNIEEISRALNVVHTISNKMLEMTINDGLKLEGILKEHKQHQHTVEKEIVPELEKTRDISRRQSKQTICIAVVLVILAAIIAAMLYFNQDKKNAK